MNIKETLRAEIKRRLNEEPNPEDVDFRLKYTLNSIVSIIARRCVLEEVLRFIDPLPEQPAEWSEEEYGRLFDIEHYLYGTLQLSPDRKNACIDFLKSLRPQPHLVRALTDNELERQLCDLQDKYPDTSWEYGIIGEAIEYIRQPHWKPSEEQLEGLEEAADKYAHSLGYDEDKDKEEIAAAKEDFIAGAGWVRDNLK